MFLRFRLLNLQVFTHKLMHKEIVSRGIMRKATRNVHRGIV